MAKGLAVGLNRGHVVTSIETPSWAPGRNPRRRVTLVRRVIKEIVGKAPYERKIMELLKQKKANSSKKAYKLAKKSLGTHKRAQRKRTELTEYIALGH
jgi:large subunit ribosomal protein L36e